MTPHFYQKDRENSILSNHKIGLKFDSGSKEVVGDQDMWYEHLQEYPAGEVLAIAATLAQRDRDVEFH